MQHIKTYSNWYFSQTPIRAGEYVVDNVGAAQAMCQDPRIEVTTMTIPDPPKLFNKGDIVICRPGSFGDLLLLTPLIQKLRRKFPMTSVKVACLPRYAPIIQTEVASFMNYPLTKEQYFDGKAQILWMEQVLERDQEPLRSYVDRFLDVAGIADLLPSEKRLKYRVTAKEKEWANDIFPTNFSRPRVALQVKASVLNRTYPEELQVRFVKKLIANDCEVFLFGAPNELNFIPDSPGIKNLSKMGLRVRESCAVLDTCRVLIAPDSLLPHVAGALGVPTILLSAPFDPEETMGDGTIRPNLHVIRGMKDCAGCRHMPVASNPFPMNQSCFKSGRCEALASIEPDLILEKTLEILEKISKG